MSTFDDAFAFTIGVEGGYVNDPKDPGGETKFGISKRAYPAEDIPNLSLDRAKYLYQRDYWMPIRGDSLPSPLNKYLFDFAVNSGVSKAVRVLQRSIGLDQDGILGPATMSSLTKMTEDQQFLYLADRVLYMVLLENWPKYGRGWVKRVLQLAKG